MGGVTEPAWADPSMLDPLLPPALWGMPIIPPPAIG